MTLKIYTTPACHWCDKAKDFFEENNIEFTEINVAEDRKLAEEMIKKSGQMGVPVIEVNGKILVGFDEDKIKKVLSLK